MSIILHIFGNVLYFSSLIATATPTFPSWMSKVYIYLSIVEEKVKSHIVRSAETSDGMSC